MPLVRKPRGGRMRHGDDESTPICRCRVLYLGSAVPHITKDGLQGIQEPLKELYPDTGPSSLKGIDSWLSVWSNGLLLENVDEKNTKITRFFPIESLHYCAAVRNVLVPASSDGGSSSEQIQKFLPLDSPFARLPNLNRPPLFACILRRTTGIKVLECHAFICKKEMAANALVRCCFHAYADSTYVKQLENGGTLANGNGFSGNGNGTLQNGSNGTLYKEQERQMQRSVTPLNSIEKVAGWALSQNGDGPSNSTDEDFTDGPVSTSTPRGNNRYEFSAEFPDEDEIYEGDENHKVWGGSSASCNNGASELVYLEPDGTLKSVKSHNSRMSKPRQFISPPPPPPPIPQFSMLNTGEDGEGTTKKKSKKKMKKEMAKVVQHQQQQMQHQQQMHQQQQQRYLMRPASMLNLSTLPPNGVGPSPGRAGSVMNGPVSNRPGSAMSTLTRPRPHLIPVAGMNGYGHHHGHHGHGHGHGPYAGYGMMPSPMMPPQAIYGHLPPPFAMPPHTLMKGSKSKGKKGKAGKMLTPVPLLAPTPMHPGMHPGALVNPTPPPMFHHPHQFPGGMEGSSGKGNKGSPEMMAMMPGSQYATIERGYHYHHNANRLQNGPGPGPGNGHNGNGNGMRMMNGGGGESATLMSNKSKSKGSKGGGEENGGSPFNTGIYRKKGHLNERAFSYSIRQEHRSRSYGSLANLQFEGGNNGRGSSSGSPGNVTAEGMKKEREIIQMVRDLDLSGDEIERSQVPPDMYPVKRVNGYHHPMQQNGGHGHGHNPGPRITHR